MEGYSHGGFHPVSLGDTLGSGRYRVLHKLGFGGSSTVWPARDRKPSPSSRNLLTLKIMTGQVSKRSLEDIPQLIIPRKLRSPSSLSDNILIPQHQFTETGPKGTHICIASPFCGPSVLSIPKYLSLKYRQRI